MTTLRDVLGDDAKLTTEAAQLIEIIANTTVARKRKQEMILRNVRSSWAVREKRSRPVYLSSKFANGTCKRIQPLKGEPLESGTDAIQTELNKHDVTVEERTFCDELLRACKDNDQAAIIQHKRVIAEGIPNALSVHIAGRLAMELQSKYDEGSRSAADFLSILNYINTIKTLTTESVPERAQVMLSVVLMFVVLFADRRSRDLQSSFTIKTAAAKTLLSLPLVKERDLNLIPFDELADSNCHPSTALGILLLISEWGLPAVDRLLRRYPNLIGSLEERFSPAHNVYLKSIISDIIKYLLALKHSAWLSMLLDLHGPSLILCGEAIQTSQQKQPPPHLNNASDGSDGFRRMPLEDSNIKALGKRDPPSFTITFLEENDTDGS
eukprot:TRINITY_DN12904_c0_g1_i1.p1 TRINITY_DN12904_c0_g1~~TRINITY_DN12904_c0_g1_i1.p1  ORF type:complete len:382 (+),score=75.55 TRINITY_DN12904_c0_g1_i1:108-1253(+)